MKTLYLPANKENILRCADIIKSGGIAAFPTETVYGLGANAKDDNAIKKIFEAKGRPQDNPLILHIPYPEMAEELYSSVPESYYKLASVFFPGALTLIYYKSDSVSDVATAGQSTVALRMPDNEIALELLRAAQVPVAAPSANISGTPSPTKAEHVYNDMNGRIDAILDGGECKIGIESTVLSLIGTPTILRPGAVTKEMLAAVIGEVQLSKSILQPLGSGEEALSPGMKYKHYSPNAQVYAVYGNEHEIANKIAYHYDNFEKSGNRCVILSSEENSRFYGERKQIILGSRKKPEEFCKRLFSALRECDGYTTVLCETLQEHGAGLAFMNRLLRASGFKTL
jgi:L-threonylcarbamoyladenylate synthase